MAIRGTRKPRWSRTKSTIEALFADGLDLRLHTTAYTIPGRNPVKLPRHWATLNGEVIWDFPRDYLPQNAPDGVTAVPYPLSPYWKGLGNRSDVGAVLQAYLDCPRDELLTRVIAEDHHDLGDLLRAADRRLGRTRLLMWAMTTLPRFDCPARKVLKARFGEGDSPDD